MKTVTASPPRLPLLKLPTDPKNDTQPPMTAPTSNQGMMLTLQPYLNYEFLKLPHTPAIPLPTDCTYALPLPIQPYNTFGSLVQSGLLKSSTSSRKIGCIQCPEHGYTLDELTDSFSDSPENTAKDWITRQEG